MLQYLLHAGSTAKYCPKNQPLDNRINLKLLHCDAQLPCLIGGGAYTAHIVTYAI